MKTQIIRFGIIGVLACVTHFIVVRTIVPFGLSPLIANIVGFLVAFQVSYWGHSSWSFSGHGNPHGKSLTKFLITASLGFALNESLYAILLSKTPLPYDIALLIVLAITAVSTFLLSRFWAFQQRYPNP